MTDDTWHQDAEARELAARFDKHGVVLHKMGPARFQLRGVVDEVSYGDFANLEAVGEHADALDKWAEARDKDATAPPPAPPQLMVDPAASEATESEAVPDTAEEKHGRRRR